MQHNSLENLFYSNQLDLINEIFDFNDFKIGIFISKHRSRTSDENEDCLFISFEDSNLRLGVADGAGGHPRGKDAAFEVCDEMKNMNPESIIAQIETANNRVLSLKAGAKSTLALAHISNSYVSFHTVGDSEIVYWNAVGRELYSSIPHSPAGHKVEAGITSQEESLTDPERHIVNSLMGDEFVQIHSTTNFELKKGHSILIGTDGIFDNIAHVELEQIANQGKFEDSFQALSNICKDQNPNTWLKDDDISFILIRKIRS